MVYKLGVNIAVPHNIFSVFNRFPERKEATVFFSQSIRFWGDRVLRGKGHWEELSILMCGGVVGMCAYVQNF